MFLCFFLNREEDTENENEKKIWYYSTKVQLAELIDCLDKDYWEAELCKILEEMREEIYWLLYNKILLNIQIYTPNFFLKISH